MFHSRLAQVEDGKVELAGEGYAVSLYDLMLFGLSVLTEHTGSPPTGALHSAARSQTPLPRTPAYSMNPIDVLAIAEVHRLKHLRKRVSPGRHTDKADMISHQTIAQQYRPMLARSFEWDLKETQLVTVIKEHILLCLRRWGSPGTTTLDVRGMRFISHSTHQP